MFYRLPNINGSAEITAKVNGKVININAHRAFQENIMDDLIQLLGDGKARVNVSCDMSAKEYGSGASVSVSLSCSVNQDEATVLEAVNKLGAKARALVKEQLVLAGNEYNALMSGSVQGA